jgi:hypothetical protein
LNLILVFMPAVAQTVIAKHSNTSTTAAETEIAPGSQQENVEWIDAGIKSTVAGKILSCGIYPLEIF